MKKTITIIHGPNLNLLGEREVNIYGKMSFKDYLKELQAKFEEIEITFFQSNIEGEIVDQIQKTTTQGIIINAAAYSHTSIAIADALGAKNIPIVNVHISNIYSREKERHQELIAKYSNAGIYGMGFDGYQFAIEYLLKCL